MEFKEGKLNYPIGELIPGLFGEIDAKKPQQPIEKKEEKKEPTLITKKEKI